MADLVQNKGEFIPDSLFVGNEVPVLTRGITLNKGVVAKRGAVLALDATSKKGVLADKSNADNLVIGILTDNVDATGGDTITTMYITGHFNSDALVFAEGTTLTDYEVELRKLGIYTDTTQGGK